MPKVGDSNEQSKREPISTGVHFLTLKQVKEMTQPNTFAEKTPAGIYKATGTTTPPDREQFIWVFESDTLDLSGKPMEYAVFTGRWYGDDRAKLTSFLDALLPEEAYENKVGLDTDALVGKRFRARIAQVKNQAGKLVPRHSMIEPDDSRPAAEAPAIPF